MKIRTVILWTIVLVAIEQVIKLVISTNYRDINFEIIPSVYISVKVPHISIEKYTTYKLERNNFVHKE